MSSSASLPFAKRFRGLFWTQFFGALNDNIFKNALVITLTFKGEPPFGMSKSMIVALAGGLFILPFFLFSGVSGRLSERVDRARIARFVTWVEFTVMALALVGFAFNLYPLLLFLLMMMGLHSTIFGPLKYSVIPELVEPKQLAGANGWVESATYVAILLGTIGGGLAASSENEIMWLAIALGGVSVAGILSSYMIPSIAPTAPDLKMSYNIFADIGESWRLARKSSLVFQSLLGISWFWLLGSVIFSVLPVYVSQHLNANAEVVTAFLTVFTIGIGIGSFIAAILAGRVSGGLIVAFGMLTMSAALADWAYVTRYWPPYLDDVLMSFQLFRMEDGFWRIMIDMLVIAVSGGIFTLPLYTWMQEFSAPGERSRVVGANNFINAAFMVSGAVGLMVLYHFKMSFMEIILILGAANFLWAAVFHFTLRPLAPGAGPSPK